MKESTTVSIRIPKSMIEELKVVALNEHFIDISEAVRSIIRKSWVKSNLSSESKEDIVKQDISAADLYHILKNKDVLRKVLDGI